RRRRHRAGRHGGADLRGHRAAAGGLGAPPQRHPEQSRRGRVGRAREPADVGRPGRRRRTDRLGCRRPRGRPRRRPAPRVPPPPVSAPRPRLGRAHLIWAVGVFAYLCAVSGRAAFGVASVEASERFGVDGAVLSLFGVVQLGTYAAAQIPAGLLLDRLGPRRMMVLGAVTMAVGQVLLAFSTDVPTALLARMLTGMGDAATLISVVRLIATWFPSGQVPVFTQLATMIGQFGQAVAAVPFLALLIGAGWTVAWSSLAFLLLFSVLLVIAVVRDEPPGDPDA